MGTENSSNPPLTDTPEAGRITHPASAASQTGFWKWLPGLYVLRHYRLGWLRSDLLAGLVLTAVLVPVGMGYATAAGLPAIYGLYATIVPLLVYAVFGPSRTLVLGPDSSLAAIIFAVIVPLAAGDPDRTVALAGMLAVFTGLLCILAGILKLGFITELLSKPIRYGYMNGIALTVLVGQLPRLFGFSAQGDNVLAEAVYFIQALLAGMANWVTLLVGASTLLFILATRRFRRFPGVLVAVVGATLATGIFDLANLAGVTVLGGLPHGLPSFTIPWVRLQDLGELLVGAIAIAVVSFADTSVLSRSLAARSGTYVNPNQEMIGLGAANFATGFFQGFSISSSASRTPVAEAAGSKTHLTGVTGAVAIALLLLFAPDLLQNLPDTALAAVVIASAISLIEIKDLRRLYRIQRWEFWLSLTCFSGVAVFGPIPGILFAIIIALLEFVWDGWRPHYAVLGRAEGVKGYHDITRYPEARLIPGLVLFRWDAPLFFANAEQFHEHVVLAVNTSPTPVRWFVLASEPVTSVDVTAADMLAELDDQLRRAGIQLVFAEMKDPVKDKLRRFGLLNRFDDRHFFPTLGQVVDAYLDSSGVAWVDWDERT
ncbi:MAG: transporter [Chloroflexi bacterium RBG_16_54_18]|nr:MAG: transporter [Chloroflexi bacterium RBG_16_54_18]